MNANTYDLVTIGGGLAGAAIARTMALAGARVLVLERETAFRDRVRGEFLAPWGIKDVERLGLLETLLAADAIPLPALAGRSLKPRPSRTPDGDVALSFSHVAAQEALLGAAEAAGAEVIRGAKVTGVQNNGTGDVSFLTPDGPATVRARIVVGADGRSSLARKALGREEHIHHSARLLAGVRLADVPADPSFGYFVINEEAGALVSLFPQADGFARAYVFLQEADPGTFAGAGGYGRFMESMVSNGVPAEALAGATQAGPLAAFVADDSWVDHPASGSLVLVGDAAGISDPTWGQGMALAFHDARVLTDELKRQGDWRSAIHRYARKRDRYYQTIITAEKWMTELQLTAGPEAVERRMRVMSAWKQDPARAAALDLPALGPALDTSERARRFIFGEDVAAASESIEATAPVAAAPPVATIGQQFLDALRERDFSTIGRLVSRSARVRALLPGGPVELHGPEPTEGVFAHWFGDVEEFEVISTSATMVGDRLRMSWQCNTRWAGESFRRVVDQHAFAKIVDGRIAVMDLLCSGFRPLPAAA